jgi:hypothetical protein
MFELIDLNFKLGKNRVTHEVQWQDCRRRGGSETIYVVPKSMRIQPSKSHTRFRGYVSRDPIYLGSTGIKVEFVTLVEEIGENGEVIRSFRQEMMNSNSRGRNSRATPEILVRRWPRAS